MYLTVRIITAIICTMFIHHAFAQNERINDDALELGVHVAGDETLFYGVNSKFIRPLSQRKHYPTIGIHLTMHFDFKGESESGAYLRHDVDMRIIPALHLGYSLNFKRIQLNFELPIGPSVAITKGTLINERVGFERSYSNKEINWHYGVGFSPKFRLNPGNQIGLYGFLPLVPDKAWSGYLYGIGWTKSFVDLR